MVFFSKSSVHYLNSLQNIKIFSLSLSEEEYRQKHPQTTLLALAPPAKSNENSDVGQEAVEDQSSSEDEIRLEKEKIRLM